MILICPPIGLTALQWVAYLPVLWALRAGDHRTNAELGYLFGWVMLFANFFWLADTVVIFSSLPYVASLLVVVLFATVFAVPYAAVMGLVHWLRARLGMGWVLMLPALQVANETLSPQLFPYYLGAVQYRDPFLWQLASLAGASGVTALIFLVNAVLGEAIYRRREGRAPPLTSIAASAALVATAYGFGVWRHGAVEARLQQAPIVRAAILQQNVGMEQRLTESAWQALSDWVVLTRKVLDQNPDLVVWPEGSVIFNPDDERKFRALGGKSPREFFAAFVSRGDFDFLIGGGTIEMHEGTTDDGRQRFTAYNSCYMFDRTGEPTGRYDKMVPLPFGEYVPFAQTFPFLKELIQGPGDFRAGHTVTRFEAHSSAGLAYSFTTPICYEAILSGQMRKMNDADLLVNITNDAWFGDTAAPHLHGMLAAVQAMQNGMPMLRIAYTGVSFVVEPHGQILYETDPFTEVATVEEIRMGREETLYRRGGWLLPWLVTLFALAGLIIARKRGAAYTAPSS